MPGAAKYSRGSETFTLVDIRLQGCVAPAIEPMPALDVVHHYAHREIDGAGQLASKRFHSFNVARRWLGGCGRSSPVN